MGISYSLQSTIDQAFDNKKLFFKPWIGKDYEKGIKVFDSEPPKRVLVIGASRYCAYLKANKSALCPNMHICKQYDNYDSLLSINDDCLFLKDITSSELQLCDINKAIILHSLYNKKTEPLAYKNFQKALAVALCQSPENIWDSIAFTNFYQPIIVHGIETPIYSTHKKEYDYSRDVIKTEITLLKPDIIIFWASSKSKLLDNIKKLFPYAFNTKITSTYSQKKYQLHIFQLNGQETVLIPSPHPTNGEKSLGNTIDLLRFIYHLQIGNNPSPDL